ncbi:MAG: DUF4202 domain-containing protein [Nitrospirae bacterium]|nr:DUF4202 domain-containing protein [Nitrospirota bacterium]
MKISRLLEQALQEFDRVNGEDPRRQTVGGSSEARELFFARKVYAWVERLNPSASEAVRLAARSHTVRRWEVPRNRYRMDTGGYRQWRAATAAHSAETAIGILKQIGYPEAVIRDVKRIITGLHRPDHPDAQLLEDADCLAFLESKLADYLDRWDEAKVRRILEGTWSKMSPAARKMALELRLDSRVKKLLTGLG